MTQRALPQKLGLKPGYRLLVLHAPVGSEALFAPLPEGAVLALIEEPAGAGDSSAAPGIFDCVLAFVRDRADLDRQAAAAVGALKPGGLLWFAYPKISAKRRSDINRDAGWDRLTERGLRPVAAIAVDATWSALRFRPTADVQPGQRPPAR
jgi:hypothetical protein